jgi:hypothetical protein
MLSRFFGENIHRHLYLLGLIGLAVGIPLNKVVMSVSMMFLGLNFFLEGKFIERWNLLKASKLYWIITGFFAIHFIAFLWSSNMDYALHDIKVKLPLFVITTLIASNDPLNRKELGVILSSFMITALLVSIINFLLYQNWIGDHQYNDIRGMSLFGSHVRFGIIVSMSAAIGLYFLKYARTLRPILFGLIIWFLFYTYYSQVIAGAMTMVGVLICYSFYLLWGRRKILALSLLAVISVVFIGVLFWLVKPVNFDPTDKSHLPSVTAEGNPYIHYGRIISPETDQPIYYYYCEKELARDWPKYSEIPFDSLDNKGQSIKITILRYLTAKELTKDADGLSKLNSEDIENIEKGIGTTASWGIVARLYGLRFSLINNENPNSNSLLKRLEHWKAGWGLFKKNWVIGVGTGDVQDSFDSYYIASNSALSEDNRYRAHNMFLTIGLTFGIFGLLLFVVYNFYFLSENLIRKEIIGVLFLCVAILSYLTEDTLETQTGITFCALFYGIFSQRIIDVKKDNG